MQLKKIKKLILNKAEQHSFFRIFLLMFLYLKDDIRKNSVSRFTVIKSYIIYTIIYFSDAIIFFLFRLLNEIRELPIVLLLRKKIILLIPYLRRFYYEIKLPENINAKEIKHFKNKNYFFLKPSLFKTIKNCYLYISTDFGIVFKNMKVITKSIHGKFDKRNLKILKPYSEIIFENYTEKAFRKNEEIITLNNDKKYLLIHHWFNYYHWITESLYRLFSINENLEDYVLLLPESFKSDKFVQDTLYAIPAIKIEYIKNESIIKFERLNFVSQKKYCDNYNPVILNRIKNYYWDYVFSGNIKSPIINDKIFISRKNAERRGISNEEELFIILKKYNFEIVDFEDYSFLEQVAILKQSKFLIGTHGSGLTNMIFMPKGSKIMELHRSVHSKNDFHSTVYWRMAGILEHAYYYQFCEPLSSKNAEKYANRKNYFNAGFHTFDIKVDLKEFENNLNFF